MQVERESAPQVVRLRVIAAERPPQPEVVDDHMEEDDPGAQVEENDAEWNAWQLPTSRAQRISRQKYST